MTIRIAALLYLSVVAGASLDAAQDASTPPTSLDRALAANPSGEQIYRAACATCHGLDGAGAPESVVGFELPMANGHGLPDFTDCAFNSVEPAADWAAIVHRGGPIRAFDRRMPAFGDALSVDQIESVLEYVRTFCTDPSWPRGDLNLPRGLFTEKAFPENETVWTMDITGSGAKAFSNELVYERRIGSRTQYEGKLPFGAQQGEPNGPWGRGIGDVELALKHAFYANLDRGSIFTAGAAVVLPTGKESEGMGNGFWMYEPFAMWGQFLGSNGFLQVHTGLEIPSDHDLGSNEGFVRTALGYSVSQDEGFGRVWSPMVELLVAKPAGSDTEWDVVPQVQVSLSKLQHVLLNVGVRVPLTEREDRKPRLLTYVLWDWFDGGLLDFWK